MQNGATRVDDRRKARGSSAGGELGLLCAELHGLHALPVAGTAHGEQSHICNRRTSVALTVGIGVGRLGLKIERLALPSIRKLILGGGKYVDPAGGLPPIFGWAPPVACLPYRVLQGGQAGYA